MFDGYETGVLVADDLAGRLLKQLADLGVDADTAVVLSPDHGEDLGELNACVDHRAADQLTRPCRSSCGGPASPAAASACGPCTAARPAVAPRHPQRPAPAGPAQPVRRCGHSPATAWTKVLERWDGAGVEHPPAFARRAVGGNKSATNAKPASRQDATCAPVSAASPSANVGVACSQCGASAVKAMGWAPAWAPAPPETAPPRPDPVGRSGGAEIP